MTYLRCTLLTRLGDHVDERRLSAFDHLNGALDGRSQVVWIVNRSRAIYAVGFGHGCIVDIRVADRRTDVSPVNSAFRSRRHVLEVHALLMVGAVVVHDAQ